MRAASKAFVVPYALFYVGNRLNFPPSVSAFLVFSYLAPWVRENRKLTVSVSNPRAFSVEPGRQDNDSESFTVDLPDDVESCGARREEPPMPRITESAYEPWNEWGGEGAGRHVQTL